MAAATSTRSVDIEDCLRVEPVLIKTQTKEDTLEPYEICVAIRQVVGNAALDGVQSINGIWRIYLKSLENRAKLLLKRKVIIQRKLYQIYDKNPALLCHFQEECERITIKDLPLSVANSEIENFLRENGVAMLSDIKYGNI